MIQTKGIKFDLAFFIKFGISILLGVGLMCAYNGIRNDWTFRYNYADGCFIAFAFLLGVSLLILLETFGAFEIFSFVFHKKRIVDDHYMTYAEYCQQHDEKGKKRRFSFLPFMLASVLFLIASLILLYV